MSGDPVSGATSCEYAGFAEDITMSKTANFRRHPDLIGKIVVIAVALPENYFYT